MKARPVIQLRKLEWSDSDGVYELLSRLDVVRYMRFPVCSREESEQFLRDSRAESDSAAGTSIVRAICDCSGGGLVGLCGLAMVRGPEEGEIWYLLAREEWGKGYATAAARQLLKMGFREFGLHRIWATCLPENPASGRVLEKAGMRREGLLVKRERIHGEWRDCWLYAMVEEEFHG